MKAVFSAAPRPEVSRMVREELETIPPDNPWS